MKYRFWYDIKVKVRFTKDEINLIDLAIQHPDLEFERTIGFWSDKSKWYNTYSDPLFEARHIEKLLFAVGFIADSYATDKTISDRDRRLSSRLWRKLFNILRKINTLSERTHKDPFLYGKVPKENSIEQIRSKKEA